MSTFGLLSPGKGIELAIQAMAHLKEESPDLRYVIAGRTHPEVVNVEGERYRTSLRELAGQLGLGERVVFTDRFLDLTELADLLGISDVVCTPYRGEDQSVSGVLTFSLAAGCAVASTPYRYARDVLADGAGILADFGDSRGLAESIASLLDEHAGGRARTAARRAAAAMPWPIVGAALRSVLDATTPQPLEVGRTHPDWGHFQTPATPLADTHLRVLCDDTAIWQHAQYATPRVEDGYCVDDAGRMLPIAADLYRTTHDNKWDDTTGRLLTFVRAAARGGHGKMRNFMSAERRWLDEPHTGDHVGRAIWGLGELIATDSTYVCEARETMAMLAPAVSDSWPTRTLAYAALGLVSASAINGDHDNDLRRIANKLHQWRPTPKPAWRWCETRLTYDNARLPEALIRVGHHLGEQSLVNNGLELLHWLDDRCLQDGSYYRFPGHHGVSNVNQLTSSGDEQPLEPTALADAHLAALTLCGDASAADAIERIWTWFLGNNRAGQPLIEINSGACYDGLESRHVNNNRGAESTIALHRCAMTRTAAQLLRTPQPTNTEHPIESNGHQPPTHREYVSATQGHP